jgi:hypothetical protein
VNTNNHQDTGNREKNVGNSGLSDQITHRFGLLRLNLFLGVLGASVVKLSAAAARGNRLVRPDATDPCSTITENLRVLRKFHGSMLTAVHIGLRAKPALCHISEKSGTGVHHINS